MSELVNHLVKFGLFENLVGGGGDDGDLLLQFGDSVGGKGVELDQHGLDGSVVGVGEGRAELIADILGDGLCLRHVDEELLFEGIDNRNRCDFGEKL